MLVFPTRLFKPQSVNPYLTGGSQTGGRSLGGGMQYGEFSGGGLWAIEFGEVVLWEREDVMAWRAMEGALLNGARAICVPLADRRHQPINSKLSTVTFLDLTIFDDGTPWLADEVDALVTNAAALRANQISFTLTSPKPLIGGEHFSILHAGNKGWRMHRITEMVSGGLGTGDATTVKFVPPLRAPVTIGTPLNFDSPRCVCRVNGPISATLEMLRFGGAQGAAFVEAFPETLN